MQSAMPAVKKERRKKEEGRRAIAKAISNWIWLIQI
jgi:hypothetical protein